MAKDREGSVNIYGAMQAKTAQGIVAYTDGIAHEKEDGTVINLDEMLKNGVGGGSAIVDVNELSYPSWSGTTVPNSGIVETLYLNLELGTQEVIEQISKLNFYTDTSGNKSYFVVYGTVTDSTVVTLAIFKNDTQDNEYSIALNSNYVLWTSTSGWNFEILSYIVGENNYFAINANVQSEFSDTSDTYTVGTQNSQLSSLFSTTPFVKGEEPKDDVFYRVKDTSNVVPSNGYIEKIYSYKNGEYKQVLQEGDTTNGIIYIDIESTSKASFSITEEKYNILKNNDNVAIRLNIVGTYNTDIYLLYKSNIHDENTITLIGISEDKKIVCVQVLSNLTCEFTSVLPQQIKSLTINNNSLIISSDSLNGVSTYSINIDTAPTSSSKNLISSGAVFTALQSYAKKTEVNQMIADYITTNFENGDEGSY